MSGSAPANGVTIANLTPASAPPQPADIFVVSRAGVASGLPYSAVSSSLAGARGSTWFTGTTAPTGITGAQANDQYLNTATGDVWTYNGTGWIETGNISGAAIAQQALATAQATSQALISMGLYSVTTFYWI